MPGISTSFLVATFGSTSLFFFTQSPFSDLLFDRCHLILIFQQVVRITEGACPALPPRGGLRVRMVRSELQSSANWS